MQEILLEAIKIIAVLTLSFASIMFFIGGIKIIFSDKVAYKHNHKSTAGFWNSVKRTVPIKRGKIRNNDVVTGIAYDLKKKKVLIHGALSNQAIERVLQ